MKRNRRSAFTLIEMLVVMVIIGILMSILLPAVMQTREAARNTECANNLKQIGLACHGYATVNNSTLPANRKPNEGDDKPYIGWNALILPFVDQLQVQNEYDFGENWWDNVNSNNRLVGEIRVPTFLCPAGPNPNRWVPMKAVFWPEGTGDANETFQMAPTDYVASAGVYYQNNTTRLLYRGAMANPGRNYAASGVATDNDDAVNLSEIIDGTTNTIMIVEMADKPNTWEGGDMVNNGTDPDDPHSIVRSFAQGFWGGPNWNHLRSWSFDGKVPFGPCAVNCANKGSIYGFHPSGANVLMCDGSVRFLHRGLTQEVFVAMVSIADGEVLSDGEVITFPELPTQP